MICAELILGAMPCLCQQYYALATIGGGDGDGDGIVAGAAFVLQHQTMHIIRLLIKFIDSTSSFIRIRINSSRKGATLHNAYSIRVHVCT